MTGLFPNSPQEERIKNLLRQLWEKHKITTMERVRILERAVEAGATLTPNDREHARRAAHKLAGSLGTFGYSESGEHAREAERLLNSAISPLRMIRFKKHVDAIGAALPIEEPQPSEVYAATLGNVSADGSAPSPSRMIECDVLLVEDDEVLSGVVVEALHRSGLRCHWMMNGAEAACALAADPPVLQPRLIVLDVDLPGLDGLSLLRTLALRGVLSRAKVMMLTAYSGREQVMESLGSGACDYIAKPFEVSNLLDHIRKALES